MLKENLIKGLRVICTVEVDDSYETENEKGTILSSWSKTRVNVEFDNEIDGAHDCEDECAYGYGLNVSNEDLEPQIILYNEKERI